MMASLDYGALRLSPFTHYYLRKFLDEYIQRLSFVAKTDYQADALVDLNLNKVLEDFYPSPSARSVAIQELELLAEEHQILKEQYTHQHRKLKETEQQLLRILDPEFLGDLDTFIQPIDNWDRRATTLQRHDIKPTQETESFIGILNRLKHLNEKHLRSKLQQPIGQRLENAGLLSPAQIEVVLSDQHYYPDLRFGEILLLRNWIKPQTLDFFLNIEEVFSSNFRQLLLGQRLQVAGLVTEETLRNALRVQRNQSIKLGEALSDEGHLNPKTIEFFAQF